MNTVYGDRRQVLISVGHAILSFLARPLLSDEMALESADVIIVLGTIVHQDGRPSKSMELRVTHGIQLLKQNCGRRLLLTGGTVSSNISEAEVMRNLAIAQGVQEESILIDSSAKNTLDNARFAQILMDKNHWKTAIVVTSPYHVKRALVLFRHAEITAQGSAAFSPNVYSLYHHMKAILHEYLAWIKLLLNRY